MFTDVNAEIGSDVVERNPLDYFGSLSDEFEVAFFGRVEQERGCSVLGTDHDVFGNKTAEPLKNGLFVVKRL